MCVYTHILRTMCVTLIGYLFRIDSLKQLCTVSTTSVYTYAHINSTMDTIENTKLFCYPSSYLGHRFAEKRHDE